jgi:tetratricopeptide (TPR) repeat protein
MIRNDYIMKMIAQLVKALAVIFKLKDTGRLDDAEREINDALQRITGMNSPLVNGLSCESLVATLRGGTELDVGKTLVIAELLKEEGDIWDARGQEEEAYKRYYKALHLYMEALSDPERPQLPDYLSKVDEVAERLEDYVLPFDLRSRMMSYFEQQGAYAAAEDVLLDMIEDDDTDAARGAGREFYARMLALTDDELEAGELPRDEVAEGLARLQDA